MERFSAFTSFPVWGVLLSGCDKRKGKHVEGTKPAHLVTLPLLKVEMQMWKMAPGPLWTVIMRRHKENRTKLTGINLPGLSDWIDCYIFFNCVTKRSGPLKRIITAVSSVSKCKMPKVHMRGCRTRPMGRDPVWRYS